MYLLCLSEEWSSSIVVITAHLRTKVTTSSKYRSQVKCYVPVPVPSRMCVIAGALNDALHCVAI